jgi:hypothetical protein
MKLAIKGLVDKRDMDILKTAIELSKVRSTAKVPSRERLVQISPAKKAGGAS